jgi:hypothetical protein
MNDELKDAASKMLIIVVINIVYLLLTGLVLWLFGAGSRTLALAAGFGLLWLALLMFSAAGVTIERVLRFNLNDRFVGFVAVNMLTSVPLVLLWAMFLGEWARAGAAAGFSAILLYLVGFVGSYIGYTVVTSLHTGTLYRMVCLPAAVIGFIVFALVPAPGQSVFGWLF